MRSTLAFAAFVISASSPSPAAIAGAWMGVTLREPVDAVRTRLGPPLLLRVMRDGSYISWNRARNPNAYLLLCERDRMVTCIRAVSVRRDPGKPAISDPAGISLGDDATALFARRGQPGQKIATGGPPEYEYGSGSDNRWVYDVRDGVVNAIAVYAPIKLPPEPATPVRDPHDGSSMNAAWIINARNEDEGVRFEHVYLGGIGCSGGGGWVFAGQALLSANGRQYDRIDVKCRTSDERRTFYFDITSFFGKLREEPLAPAPTATPTVRP